ncbi:uncharacterized oxidoreductase YjmC-like isoform X2 [Xyrichtys novacula]|uniref:Uncharacterized oxidoreductase YjmC-like isoform X2 n=1 Tax=Xyrichtys novacula TaxID=13765 RepID=A0AAV1HNR1_XYRNO|nr:uncharacterized oxidoreductase YjmC-like isoform X2 [Xyrichtys novacula]
MLISEFATLTSLTLYLQGQCFVAISPENFAPGFNGRMTDLLGIHIVMDPADPNCPVLVAGDPERMNMKKCDDMGGIPYHINVVNYMVRDQLWSET